MMIEGCSFYNIDVYVQKRDSEFYYRYQYQGHDFEGKVSIRAISDPAWIEAVFQVILENEIEQYEIDRLAERYMGGQETDHG